MYQTDYEYQSSIADRARQEAAQAKLYDLLNLGGAQDQAAMTLSQLGAMPSYQEIQLNNPMQAEVDRINAEAAQKRMREYEGELSSGVTPVFGVNGMVAGAKYASNSGLTQEDIGSLVAQQNQALRRQQAQQQQSMPQQQPSYSLGAPELDEYTRMQIAQLEDPSRYGIRLIPDGIGGTFRQYDPELAQQHALQIAKIKQAGLESAQKLYQAQAKDRMTAEKDRLDILLKNKQLREKPEKAATLPNEQKIWEYAQSIKDPQMREEFWRRFGKSGKTAAAEDKAAKAEATAAKQREGTLRTIGELQNAITDVLGFKGIEAGLGVAANLPWWASLSPDTKTKANARIDQLNEVAQTIGLTDLRSSGVAPGSITEREWPKFAAMVGNLKPQLGKEHYFKQLERVKAKYEEIAQDLRNQGIDPASLQMGGGQQPAQPASTAAPVPIQSEAEASRLPKGTIVIINGRRAVVE